MSETRTLARRRGSKQELEGERADSMLKKGRFQGGEGGQGKRAYLREKGESMSG